MSNRVDLFGEFAPPLHLRRFTVQQYRQLGELGVLTPDDNVELLEGWIVEKMNQRPILGFLVRLLNDLFMRELPEGWICQCQLPIATERSEPEPDLAILKGQHADFRCQHPQGKDCALIVEVADTSLEKDRAKAELYRTAGVTEYWIVNVADACIEQYQFAASPATRPQTWKANQQIEFIVGDKVLIVDLRMLFEDGTSA